MGLVGKQHSSNFPVIRMSQKRNMPTAGQGSSFGFDSACSLVIHAHTFGMEALAERVSEILKVPYLGPYLCLV